jgi:16S rRNA (guanine527-N7)-methyltransferase
VEPDFSDVDLEWFEALCDLVLEANKTMNLTRITDREEFFVKHILDSALPFFLVPELVELGDELRAADLGSGAGFPGLVLARMRPGWEWVLIERRRKKAAFLERAAKELGLDNVSVAAVNAREADIPRRDLITARAVGRMVVVTREVSGLLRKNGLLVHYKGGGLEEDEVHESFKAAKNLRMVQSEPVEYSLPGGDGRAVVLSRSRGHRQR